MKSLQGAANDFKDLGVNVHGISRDSVTLQAAFAKKCELKMPLLSDPDGSATEKYDCAYEGRPFAKRVTFVIDPAGKVRVRDEKVSFDTHGPDLVAAIRDMQDD